MKKNKTNTIMFLLIGIIIGLTVALIVVLTLKNKNETVIIDNTTTKEEEKIKEQKWKEDTGTVINTSDPVTYFTNINK